MIIIVAVLVIIGYVATVYSNNGIMIDNNCSDLGSKGIKNIFFL